MSKIVKYFEDYINSESNEVRTLLQNMIEMFKKTFNGENDILSENELSILTLTDIEKSNVNDVEKQNLIINFTDDEYYYQVIFIINLNDIKKNITQAYIKIKIYDYNLKLKNEYKTKIKIKIPTDNEIYEKGFFYLNVKRFDDKNNDYEYLENFIISVIGNLKTL